MHEAQPSALSVLETANQSSIIPVVYERERCFNWFAARLTGFGKGAKSVQWQLYSIFCVLSAEKFKKWIARRTVSQPWLPLCLQD